MVKYLWLDPSTGDTAVRANQPTGWVHVYYYNIDNALIVSTIPSIRQFVETHSTNAIPPSGIIGNKISSSRVAHRYALFLCSLLTQYP